jgi:hypothetical protein
VAELLCERLVHLPQYTAENRPPWPWSALSAQATTTLVTSSATYPISSSSNIRTLHLNTSTFAFGSDGLKVCRSRPHFLYYQICPPISSLVSPTLVLFQATSYHLSISSTMYSVFQRHRLLGHISCLKTPPACTMSSLPGPWLACVPLLRVTVSPIRGIQQPHSSSSVHFYLPSVNTLGFGSRLATRFTWRRA